MKHWILRSGFAAVVALLSSKHCTEAAGTWTALHDPTEGSVNSGKAPGGVALMLLLSDGSVMAASRVPDPNEIPASGGSRVWYRLTPDIHGSYASGTWTTLESSQFSRLWYSSAVMRDGRVLVAGGEYGTGGFSAEVYDPATGHWTTTPSPGGVFLSDAASKILPDGRVLVAPASTRTTRIYDPVANTWSAGPTPAGSANQNEVTWLKLPDDSILTVPTSSTTSQRMIPSLNRWVVDATVPVSLYTTIGAECGGSFLLPDGRCLFLGGTNATALYTPSGNATPGTWAAGPTIPSDASGNMQGAPDAGAAMMVNGKILCAFSRTITASDSAGNAVFPSGVKFYEYDSATNTFGSALADPGGVAQNIPAYQCLMLALPDGNVLYSNFGDQLYLYTPDGVPLAAGKPTISSISANADGSYTLLGTGLNGISEGASYGDDAQMDTNYPIIRLSDGGGNVYYAKTFDWSSTSVMTGARPVATKFRLPGGLAGVSSGTYSLVVVANGISSDPIAFSFGETWMDFNFGGLFGFGTYEFPFKDVPSGVAGVVTGGTIKTKSSSTAWTGTINKALTIRAIGGSVTIGQ